MKAKLNMFSAFFKTTPFMQMTLFANLLINVGYYFLLNVHKKTNYAFFKCVFSMYTFLQFHLIHVL